MACYGSEAGRPARADRGRRARRHGAAVVATAKVHHARGQAGSEKMRGWARRELNGYAGAETVPDYRHIPAALMAVITNRAGYNGITQRIDDSVFPRPDPRHDPREG